MPFHHVTGALLLLALLLPAAAPTPGQLSTPPPTLISPAEGAVMDNGCSDQSEAIIWDFDWEDVPGASEYHIKVWHNPEKPVVNDRNVTVSEYHDVSRKSHIIERNRKGWHWAVRAKIRDVWGPWSEVRSFEAEPPDTDCL